MSEYNLQHKLETLFLLQSRLENLRQNRIWFFISHQSESFTSEQVSAYSLCKQSLAKHHSLNLVQSIAELQKLLGTLHQYDHPSGRKKMLQTAVPLTLLYGKSSDMLDPFCSPMNCL